MKLQIVPHNIRDCCWIYCCGHSKEKLQHTFGFNIAYGIFWLVCRVSDMNGYFELKTNLSEWNINAQKKRKNKTVTLSAMDAWHDIAALFSINHCRKAVSSFDICILFTIEYIFGKELDLYSKYFRKLGGGEEGKASICSRNITAARHPPTPTTTNCHK